MTLSQLYYFRKLAQLEHFTKAAHELYITQPSLSASIASLEEELDTKLFQKSGRNVHLTDAGRQFYETVCQCLNILENGIEDLQTYSDGESVIDIACEASLLSTFIPTLLAAFQEKYGDSVKFHLHCDEPSNIIGAIRSGKYSFVFCSQQYYDRDLSFIQLQYDSANIREDELLLKNRSLISILSVTDERGSSSQVFLAYNKLRRFSDAEQKFIEFIKNL